MLGTHRNILILSQGADFYGSNFILLEAAKHLKQQGYRLHVLFPYAGPIINEFEKSQISTGVMNLGILRRKYVSFFGLINRSYFFTSSFIKILVLIKNRKIDIIYSNGLGVLVGIFAALFSGKKHIWHLHEIIEKPTYFYLFYRELLNLPFGLNIAVSEAVRSFWIKSGRDHFKVIHNGIPIPEEPTTHLNLRDELGLPPDCLLIGMIGRVTHLKGQDYFIRICHELLKQDKTLKFIMVGDVYPGNEGLYKELKLLKNELGVDGAIFDLGFRRDIPDLLNSIDLFILPSVMPDSFPTVILEAMGQGRAIVATSQGGALEMIDENISGVFIPIEDEITASKIIFQLLQNRKARIEMGIQARKKVLTTFSSSKFKRNLLEAIESYISN